MRLLLMCASEVSEGVEVMEGGRRKSDKEEEEEGRMKARFPDANSSPAHFRFGGKICIQAVSSPDNRCSRGGVFRL